MEKTFYITTAIDYSNGDPHIGHAFEKLGADCIARYKRIRGYTVKFCIGMDEHGQNVAQTAEAAGMATQEWVDRIAETFQDTWRVLSISNTDFIRTTEPRHERTVQELLRRISSSDQIYQGSYKGYYCIGCEAFKLEKDLVDGQCSEHPTREVKWVEEPNYFFRLSEYSQWLLDLYTEDPEFLRPKAKMNEIRNIVEAGLQDLSVSRSKVPWGIQWPDDPEHTIYVWFDALINYLSATGFPSDGWDDMWPADLHVIGPDIARFHAAIWPAMLQAAQIPIPRGIWSHGWVKLAGGRFSKTAGVKIQLNDAIERYGPDALRYFLLREVPWDSDGNFSWERFDARYTSDLADGYGNLSSRVLAMIVKYCDATVPSSTHQTELDTKGSQTIEKYAKAMDNYLLHNGARTVWDLVAAANGFIEESAPWALAKQGDSEKLSVVLAALARCLCRITILATPFLPTKAEQVWSDMGMAGDAATAGWDGAANPQVAGSTVTKPNPLFPKPATA